MKKIIILLLITVASFCAALIASEKLLITLYSFLRVNKPIKAEALVVEGWMSESMLKEAAEEFLIRGYSYCLVSGKPKRYSPVKVLVSFGVNPSVIGIVQAETKKGHNTYHMALAAQQWFVQNHPEIKTINVFTAGPHGRKSWIIFKRVFGRKFNVGVISLSVSADHPKLGWKNIQGFKNMVRYLKGYVYAKVWLFD